MYNEAISDCEILIRNDSNAVEAYYVRGCAQEKLGQLENAIREYTTVLNLDPGHINAAYSRGACQNRIGNFTKAIEDYMMALEKDTDRPLSPPPKLKSVVVPRNLQEMNSFNFESTTSTPGPLFTVHVKLAPQNSDYFIQGIEARKRGDLQESIGLFSEGLKKEPENFKAWFYRGLVYDKLGQFKEAEADYSQSIRINDQNALSYYNRGIVREKQGKHKQAYADFNKAVQISPQKPEFLYNRGYSLIQLEDYQKAISDFTACIMLNNSAKAYFQRGFCQEQLENYNQAEEDYLQSLSLEPKDISVLEALCMLYIANQRENEVLDLLEEALTDYQPFEIAKLKGKVLQQLEMYPEAISEFEQAIEENSPEIWKLIGLCYANIEDYSKAIEMLSRSLDLDRTDIQVISARALC